MLTSNSATLVTSNISSHSTRSNTKSQTFTDTIENENSNINMGLQIVACAKYGTKIYTCY